MLIMTMMAIMTMMMVIMSLPDKSSRESCLRGESACSQKLIIIIIIILAIVAILIMIIMIIIIIVIIAIVIILTIIMTMMMILAVVDCMTRVACEIYRSPQLPSWSVGDHHDHHDNGSDDNDYHDFDYGALYKRSMDWMSSRGKRMMSLTITCTGTLVSWFPGRPKAVS